MSILNYDDVRAAAASVSESGERVTINRVREALGGRGTPATISRLLKKWRDETDQSGDASSKAADAEVVASSEVSGEAKGSDAPADPTAFADGGMQIDFDVPKADKAAQDAGESGGKQGKSGEQFEGKSHGRRHRGDRHRNRQNGDKREADGEQRNGHEHRERNNKQRKQYDQRARRALLDAQYDVYQSEDLASLSDEQLVNRIRRLEAFLNKEQSRRETAEKMARDAQEYAEVIKEQIGQRIKDLEQTNEQVIKELKAQAREYKQVAEQDLRYYREKLDQANQKVMDLATKKG